MHTRDRNGPRRSVESLSRGHGLGRDRRRELLRRLQGSPRGRLHRRRGLDGRPTPGSTSQSSCAVDVATPMTEGHGHGTTRAVAAFLVDRAHLLLPLASQLGEAPSDFESTIRGSSMAPAIPAGARLRVRLNGRESCQVGDVVFYLADGGVYTVHRVVYRARRASAKGHLLTEGDARFAP